MGVFADGAVDHAAEAVEEDGARAAVAGIEGGALNRGSGAEPQRRLRRGSWGMKSCLAVAHSLATKEGSRAERSE